MRISRMIVMGLLGSTLVLTGCKNKQETANLTEQVTNLQTQLDDRNKALEDCSTELRARDQKLAELMRSGGANTTGGPAGEGWTSGGGEMTLTLSSDTAFDSGRASLKPAAKKTLDGIAQTLNSSHAGSHIRIAGHTDPDPIKKSGFKSNYHLAFERAWSVREYLITKGVAANRLSLASYGPDAPKGSKSASRRVEIVVVNGGSTATASAAGH